MGAKLDHPVLVDYLRKAYSAEKAASYAYIGHAGSLHDPDEIAIVRQIELDEWEHRQHVLEIMQRYDIPVSRFYELGFGIIGRVVGFSCYVLGRFMPYFFAGKIESGNVCAYFLMMRYFHSLGITEHDEVLFAMGVKEKEHEAHFVEVIRDAKWLPLFERVFNWGVNRSENDVDLHGLRSVETADRYCPATKAHSTKGPADDRPRA